MMAGEESGQRCGWSYKPGSRWDSLSPILWRRRAGGSGVLLVCMTFRSSMEADKPSVTERLSAMGLGKC